MSITVRHAVTSDGVAIAFAAHGSGPLLISVPAPPDNHIQLEWDDPARRSDLERMGRFRTVVRYDGRGCGLSDRRVADFSLEARVRDLEAVLSKVDAETFAIMTGGHGAQVGVAYAAANPERVTHLVAVNPLVQGGEFLAPGQQEMFEGMIEHDYTLFTEAIGGLFYGWGKEEATRYSAFFRAAVDGPTALAIYSEILKTDIAELLPRVRCPVLVVCPNEAGFAGSDTSAGRRFAALVPNGEMVVVPGKPASGPTGEVCRHVGRFLGEDWSEEADFFAHRPAAPAIRVILFTDLESHTAMIQSLGDERGRTILREHERLTRDHLRTHGGIEVKSMGDGFMASFTSVQGALECATALQRACVEAGPRVGYPIAIRIGVNAGGPIAEDGDLFGTSVITASRIAALAAGGEVLVSNVVRELVAGKSFLFSDRGHHALKGLDEPVKVWQLGT